MNSISEITRRDIIDLFKRGYTEFDFLGNRQNVFYIYYGRLTEIEFLKKLYQLEAMPSNDPRFENAEGDIWQHTMNNEDWEYGWVFDDNRFELNAGSDIIILNFLSAVFNPENRAEDGNWKSYLEKVNNLINPDGYELYESDKVSNRTVYSWRKLTKEEQASGRFIPFSLRHKNSIEKKTIVLPTISKKLRFELCKLIGQYDDTVYRTTETNWNYTLSSKAATIEDIQSYYLPKAFDARKNYSVTDDLEHFIMCNYPHSVFDAIELFSRINEHSNFSNELNLLLQNNSYPYKLLGGKMEASHISIRTKEVIKEIGLKELIEQATNLYESKIPMEKQLAVEKLWDAFERLKTYYVDLDKKSSAEKVINEISQNNDKFKELFQEEFIKLTTIGNKYRIRHHETDKIDITDLNYYEYFFQRCLALINLSLKYMK